MSNRALPRGVRRIRRPSRRDESGAALVEFALVFGLFVFVMYGLIVLGMALAVKQSVTNAAAEAARSAVGSSDNATAVTTAQTTADGRMGWLGSHYVASSDRSITWFNPSTNACDSAYTPPAAGSATICVSVSIPYKSRGIVPPAPLINHITPSKLTSTAIVRVR